MIFIAHRGNLNGPNKETENRVSQIDYCLSTGHYEVEVDVWKIENKFILSHHYPGGNEDVVDLNYLKNPKIWCHAKNLDAFKLLLNNKSNCFWHQNDDFALTTSGFIWTFPGKPLCYKSICMYPESYDFDQIRTCAGICSDYITKYLGEL